MVDKITIGVVMGEIFEPIEIRAVKGDVITSKIGILMKSSMTNKFYRVKKLEVIGNGTFVAIQKELIEVDPIENNSENYKCNHFMENDWDTCNHPDNAMSGISFSCPHNGNAEICKICKTKK
jgi:hypothetical protein